MVLQASRGVFPKLLNVMPQWSDEGNRSGSRLRGHESTGAEVEHCKLANVVHIAVSES